MSYAIIILVVVIVLIIGYVISLYNGLIRLKNAVGEAFSSIDVQLKKRHDLIPNFVETVKQYMTHEKDTLAQIVALRSQATDPNLSNAEKMEVENKISASMRNIMIQVEAYPELKANEGFNNLQETLKSTEDSIASARTGYNSAVTTFNNACMVFPANIFAGMFGFRKEALFEAPAAEKENVNVKNLFNN